MKETEQKPTPRRLTRSKTDAVIAGVAGGIAEYLDIDSTVIRVLFIILVFAAGFGLLLYLLLALIMPAEDSSVKNSAAFEQNIKDWQEKVQGKAKEFRTRLDQRRQVAKNGRYFLGYVLLIFGVLFMLQNLHLFDFVWLGNFWPVILIVLGFLILVH